MTKFIDMFHFFSHIFETESYHQLARDTSDLSQRIATFAKSKLLYVVFVLQDARQIFQTLVSNETQIDTGQ